MTFRFRILSSSDFQPVECKFPKFVFYTRYNFRTTDRDIAGEAEFVGVAEPEIAHALGRTVEFGTASTPTILDLFRFSAPGVLATSPTEVSYFSEDGGVTPLKYFDWTNSDPSD
jgi:hypothetical protein